MSISKSTLVENLNQLRLKCRACLSSKGTLVPIFSDLKVYDRVMRLNEVLRVYGDIKLEPDDELPQKLCFGCVLDIAAAVIFRERCQKSDLKFRKLLANEKGQPMPLNAVYIVDVTPSVSNVETIKKEDLEIKEEVIFLDDSDSDEEDATNDNILENEEGEEEKDDVDKNVEEEHLEMEKSEAPNIDPEMIEVIKSPPEKIVDQNVVQTVENQTAEIPPTPEGSIVPKIPIQPKKPDDPLRCRICQIRQKSIRGLTHHLAWHKSKEIPYVKPTLEELTCKICNKVTINRKFLSRHMDSHNEDEPYNCEHCDQKFKREKSRLLHIVLNHPEVEHDSTRQVFECPFCKQRFFKSRYSEHLRKHTGERPTQCAYCLNSYVSNKKICEHLRYTCRKAEQHFTENADEDDENKSGGPFEETKLDSGVTVVKIRRSEWIRCGKFRCDQCTRKFPSNMQLERHKKNHSDSRGETVYRRAIPDKEKVFFDGTNLCEICGKNFLHVGSLRVHMKAHENTERLFPCTVCGRKYFTAFKLKWHMKNHNSSCEFCTEQFETLAERVKHKQTMHLDQTVYDCTKCDMKFNDKKLLYRHNINKHWERKHCCTICPFKFPSKDKLKCHMRTHTKEKPFYCGLCDRRFGFRSNWIIHNRKFHPELPEC